MPILALQSSKDAFVGPVASGSDQILFEMAMEDFVESSDLTNSFLIGILVQSRNPPEQRIIREMSPPAGDLFCAFLRLSKVRRTAQR